MVTVLVVATVLLLIAPAIGFMIYAGWMRFTFRRFKLHAIRFRSVLWITAVLTAVDLGLAAVLHFLGLTNVLWGLGAIAVLFVVFLWLVRRYEPITVRRALGVYATITALSILTSAVAIIAIVVPLRLLVASPFEVKGASMAPAYEADDLVFVDKLAYRSRDPQRGDVVVLIPPGQPGQYYVKRIVGLPEEKVRIRGGEVTVFNSVHPDGFTLSEPYLFKEASTEALTAEPMSVPAGSYFVLGDNREHSNDSRYWGTVPRQNIVGIIALRVWPPA
jgi:signal peptidase I